MREKPYGDYETRYFFDNLLFENVLRDQVMQRHDLDYTDVVGLLFHLGKDCPGAISCVPKGEGPSKQPGNLETDYDSLDQLALETLMTSLRDRQRMPAGIEDPSPLAGVQGKVALARLPDGQFALPKASLNVPTTHILKVPRRTELRLVEQEHLLLRTASQILQHPVSATEVIGEGTLLGLLVERFDRALSGAHVHRLHQEDFCQALGLGPRQKYERNGPPGRAFSARSRRARCFQPVKTPAGQGRPFLKQRLSISRSETPTTTPRTMHCCTRAIGRILPRSTMSCPPFSTTRSHTKMSFNIGEARMTDEISSEGLLMLLRQLGYRRNTPALRRRMQTIVSEVVMRIPDMHGPSMKRVGDAMAEQCKWIARALLMEIEIPERDLIVINRP